METLHVPKHDMELEKLQNLLDFNWHVLCFLVGAASLVCLHIALCICTPLVQLLCAKGESQTTVQKTWNFKQLFCY